MHIKDLFFVSEQGVPDLVYRSFETTPVFDQVIKTDQKDLDALSVEDKEKLLNSCLRLCHEDQGVIPIPSGWQANRLRFHVELNDDRYCYHITGYTDRDVIQDSTEDDPKIDPSTRLYFSSMTCIEKTTQTEKEFHFIHREHATYNINALLHEMRPASVLMTIPSLDWDPADRIIDVRTAFVDTRVKISDAMNATPCGYMVKLLQGLSYGPVDLVDQNTDVHEFYNDKALEIQDPGMQGFPLINKLIHHSAEGLLFSDLQKEIPELDSVTTILTRRTAIPNEIFSPWSGSEPQTLLAASIVRHLIAQNFPTSLEKDENNTSLYRLKNGIDPANGFGNVLFPPNQSVTVFIDDGCSSYITLRVVVKDNDTDESTKYSYKYPFYCDNLALPILTKRYEKLRDLAASIFQAQVK